MLREFLCHKISLHVITDTRVTMTASSSPFPPRKTRLGFHYYPDTLHYCESDLQHWLPELRAMGASWLVVQSSVDRAIPEHFLRGLIEAGIEPIIRFETSLSRPVEPAVVSPLLQAYAHWGVNGIVWFDRPNARRSWEASEWAQQDLVERFLDRYLPLANATIQAGLAPILPPLEPGGSYWDTAFLRTALESLRRRKQTAVLHRLVLSAYAWTHQRPLNWGAGGPDRWPAARPYIPRDGEEDQCSFRIFDWYNAIAEAVLDRPRPIILFAGGSDSDPYQRSQASIEPQAHNQTCLTIAKLLNDETVRDPNNPLVTLDPIPPEVISCSFWLLTADIDSQHQSQTWYLDRESRLPIVNKLKIWNAEEKSLEKENRYHAALKGLDAASQYAGNGNNHPIRHYLLLPTYEFGVADWHLNIIRPYIKKHRPTVGFSLTEAALASRVTVVGNAAAVPDEVLDSLRQTGSLVERINGDGTSIATNIAER
jgi:hypothetical protein